MKVNHIVPERERESDTVCERERERDYGCNTSAHLIWCGYKMFENSKNLFRSWGHSNLGPGNTKNGKLLLILE